MGFPPLTHSRLTERQELFCRYYVSNGFFGAKAVIAAGYSKNAADVQSTQLLQMPHIKERIAQLLAPREQEMAATRDRVMQELSRIAFADIRELYDERGQLKPIHELPAAVAAALASVEEEKRLDGRGEDAVDVRTKKVRQWDKLKALEMLSKILQLYDEKANVTVPVQVNIGDQLSELDEDERALLRQLAEKRLAKSEGDAPPPG